MPTPALLLIAHGSPDPDWRAPIDAVHARARELAGDRRVELCFMERSAPSLERAVEILHADGVRHVEVVALLLSGGGRHMKKDLPAELERLRSRFEDLRLELRPRPIGAAPGVIEALARAAVEI